MIVHRRSRWLGRSRGRTLGAVPWLLPCILMTVATPWSASPGRAYPDEFPLFPTRGHEEASGIVHMRQPWSPFGISVDEEGRVLHDLEVTVQGLPAVEGESYHVWLTEPTLERVVHLGAIESDGTVSGRTDWHQLMVVVSRESSEHAAVVEGDRWTGPIVLRGFSAGARVQPLGSHSIFQPTPM